jgi:7-carboxy-7-deazaguanine synthase
MMEIEEIIARAVSIIGSPRLGPNAPFVEVTGGEPLAQSDTISLLTALVKMGYEVALETAGSHDIKLVPCNIIKIVDRKTPDSGAVKYWLDSNLEFLIPDQDELKFVLCSRDDYFWAKDWCEANGIFNRLNIIFSPVSGSSDIVWFADKIVKDLVPVRFQLQLHKLIWGPDKRGV